MRLIPHVAISSETQILLVLCLLASSGLRVSVWRPGSSLAQIPAPGKQPSPGVLTSSTHTNANSRTIIWSFLTEGFFCPPKVVSPLCLLITPTACLLKYCRKQQIKFMGSDKRDIGVYTACLQLSEIPPSINLHVLAWTLTQLKYVLHVFQRDVNA